MVERATAIVTTGNVCLANAWLERRWSTFTGATTELILRATAQDYLTRKSPEYHIDYGDRPLAVHDLGSVHWSEHVDGNGASVTLEQSGPGLTIQLQTFLSHARPGMMRRLQLTNTGVDTVVTRVATDILPLDPTKFSMPEDRSNGQGPLRVGLGESFLYYCPLHVGTGELLIGAPGPNDHALFTPNPAYCAPVWQGTMALIPGKTWVAPHSGLYWGVDRDTASLTPALNALHAEWMEHLDTSQHLS